MNINIFFRIYIIQNFYLLHILKSLIFKIAALSILLLIISNIFLFPEERHDYSCYLTNDSNELNQALKVKEDTFNTIQFNLIIKKSIPPKEKPCTLYLYNLAESEDNIWYKFYCGIIADQKGYTEYANSLFIKLLKNKNISINEHILMALEFAKFNKINLMEKHFQQAKYKFFSCNIIPEYIWLNSNIYIVSKLIEFSPQSYKKSNRIQIHKFNSLVRSTILIFPNFNGKSIVMTFLTELLLRNSEYELAKEFKSFSLKHSASFGGNSVDFYELSIISIIEDWIFLFLALANPIYLFTLIASILSSSFNITIIKKAIYSCLIIIIIILLTFNENHKINSTILFLKNAPNDFKYGLKKSNDTLDTINKLYDVKLPESIFLLALYNQINNNQYTSYELYQSILSNKNTKNDLRVKALNNLGVLSLSANEIIEAKAYFKMALIINKNYTPSLYNLYLINKNQKLLASAMKVDKMKINTLISSSPNKPYLALLNYQELIKTFSSDRNPLNSLKKLLTLTKNNKIESIIKLELLIMIIMLFLALILSKVKKINNKNIKVNFKKISLINKFLKILLPGYFLILKGRTLLGTIFMFSFIIGVALLYKIIIDNSFLQSISPFIQVWYGFMEKNNFNTSALINPFLYSVSLYLTFVSFFISLLISILGTLTEKNQSCS